MGFGRGVGGGYPDLPAKIANIGIDYVEYENKSQHRIVVVYKPLAEDSALGEQTNMLNTSNELVTGGKEETISIGMENSFAIDIVGDIVVSGTIGGKAKVWLDALEELGYNMTELEDTGDLAILVGLEAEWRQMTYSEAVGREENKEYPEKKFWMPVKLLSQPKKKASEEEGVLSAMDGRTEKEMLAWSKEKGKKASNVFSRIDKAIQEGNVKMVDEKYQVIEK